MADQSKVDAICALVAMGDSQRAACRAVDVEEATFRLWRRDSEEIDSQYARAVEDRAQLWAEQLVEIADTPVEARKTVIKPDGSEEITIGDAIEHRKLQIDARKWMMSRILPKQFGDKSQLEVGGPNGGPIQSEHRIVFVEPEK